jgi:hemerythrin-like domain-containing protein
VSRVSRAGRVVLNNLSKEIRECYRHAEDCALKAIAHTDAQLKQSFLDLEQRWLFLARSYEFSERLTTLSNETKRQADKLPKV